MEKAEIISIGSELVSGKVVDTTSSFISRKLSSIGVTITHKSTIPDQVELIVKTIRETWKRASIVIITGGLGPTHDDITKIAISKAFGLKMIHYPQVEASLKQFHKKLKKKIPRISLNQAFLPESSIPLKNSWGTAPGIYIKKGKKRMFVLPGVPQETTNMMAHRVLPILSRELETNKLNSQEINIFGIGESTVQEALENIPFPEKATLSYLPASGGVKLLLTGKASKKQLQAYSKKIIHLFRDNVYSQGEITLEQALGKILKQKKLQLAVAESCTGGMLGSYIVNSAGSSSYFAGGVIAYSNKVKINILGVPPSLLKKHGAVSLPVAKAMATGVAKKLASNCGIGITGVAGPKGGTSQKPVGCVAIATCYGKKNTARLYRLYGDRSFIRQRAVATALFQMLSLLKNRPGAGTR